MAKANGITMNLPVSVISEECSVHFVDHVDGPEIAVETEATGILTVKLSPEKTAEIALWFRQWITQPVGN
jgi:hypothetical protein